MQSSFKERPAPFIDEMQRDLRATVENADHIILFGYSLPLDDVAYRAFFSARKGNNQSKKCSVVVGTNYSDEWLIGNEIPDNAIKSLPALQSAVDIFGKENVRYYGHGIPNVFCSGGSASPSKIAQLLDPW